MKLKKDYRKVEKKKTSNNDKKLEEFKATSEKPTCEFCKVSFAKEETLLVHVCAKKERWLSRDEKHVKMGFMFFQKYHFMSFRATMHRNKTFEDFINSTLYVGFVRFAKYIIDINAIDPEKYIEFLIKAQVPLKNWEKQFVYEQYIRELNKTEPVEAAFERNVLLMQQWSMDTGSDWNDFFREVNPILATKWIQGGRISPWILYTAESAEELFARMSPEQLTMIEKTIEPRFWERKFKESPDDLAFVQSVLKDAGL